MRMSQGVEWAVHTLLALSCLEDDQPVPTATLAAGHDLPRSYLNKQLQRLVKAGLLTSEPGAQGGFRLARPPASITMLDVVEAIEGDARLFRCTEIRQCGTIGRHGGGDFSVPCAVTNSMRKAEEAWREALAGQTLAAVLAEANEHAPAMARAIRQVFGRE
ncbi:Rrf2 family transcriptional regulator [Streptomyces sp. NPDC052701]|uniref:RrF2 family transcriptional regulator n=1 Tax=Streptomyces sp. NPDC052701 TaxID=3155533 RepID=UPI00341D00A5